MGKGLNVRADVAMDNPSGPRDGGRYTSLGYMGMIGGAETGAEIYGRPTSTSQLAAAAAAAAAASQMGRGGATMMAVSGAATPGVPGPVQTRGIKRPTSDVCYAGAEDGGNVRQHLSQSMSGMPGAGDCVPDNLDESFTNLGQPKKSPPSNGKKTKGRVKIKMEYIDNKLRRYTTFSKRKTGIMKKVCVHVYCIYLGRLDTRLTAYMYV